MPAVTYETAMAAARDAGNRDAKARGLARWDSDAYMEACKEFNRLYSFGVDNLNSRT